MPANRSRAKGLFLVLIGMAAYLFGTMVATPVTLISDGEDLWTHLRAKFETHGLSRACVLAGGMLIVVGAVRVMRSGR